MDDAKYRNGREPAGKGWVRPGVALILDTGPPCAFDDSLSCRRYIKTSLAREDAPQSTSASPPLTHDGPAYRKTHEGYERQSGVIRPSTHPL